ncbi:MAG TPA: hypothetical protein VF587_07940 [Solirubrobacteraceae bacterium]|jgi:hypothetical protein
MTGPVVSILVLTVVHFAAFGALFWHLAGREIFGTFRIGPDDDDRRRFDPPPRPPDDGDRRGGVPLPDAAPAPVRLREPGRLADGYPRRTRRPEHVPGEPVRTGA